MRTTCKCGAACACVSDSRSKLLQVTVKVRMLQEDPEDGEVLEMLSGYVRGMSAMSQLEHKLTCSTPARQSEASQPMNSWRAALTSPGSMLLWLFHGVSTLHRFGGHSVQPAGRRCGARPRVSRAIFSRFGLLAFAQICVLLDMTVSASLWGSLGLFVPDVLGINANAGHVHTGSAVPIQLSSELLHSSN